MLQFLPLLVLFVVVLYGWGIVFHVANFVAVHIPNAGGVQCVAVIVELCWFSFFSIFPIGPSAKLLECSIGGWELWHLVALAVAVSVVYPEAEGATLSLVVVIVVWRRRTS